MARVAVAMSGGVDSTVAALLLKRWGYELVGVFMRNWDERDERGQCTTETDYREVEEVCGLIGIPCRLADFVREYWNDVFSEFLQGYQAGHTPNPDILCNQHIKFRAFLDHALRMLGVDFIATGHYARIRREQGRAKLLQSADKVKDQTYFLSQVSKSALQQTLFPIGNLTKQEVRRIAVEAGLGKTASRKESMGLCFIGKRDFPQFIREYLEEKPGYFVSLDGRTVGQHRGHHFFTVGQRARIGGQTRAWFVAGKDPHSNTVTVVEGSNHSSLFTSSLSTSPPHWISGVPPDPLARGQTLECEVRCRHQQPLRRCTVDVMEEERREAGHWGRAGLRVRCERPLRAVTPGQYAVFYSGEECVGGACISEAGPSLWQQELILR